MKSELKQRWRSGPGQEFIQRLVREGRSGNGYTIRESPFGRLPTCGRIDLRGLELPEQTELRRIRLTSGDTSEGSFKRTLVESCEFTDVCFDDVAANNLTERGNTFEGCHFRKSRFAGAAFGYLGSRFTRCKFIGADFCRAVFIRPEFDDCLFDSCELSGVDFNAASFDKGEFCGELREVWFRGGFAIESHSERYGNARPNNMTFVNFSKARLFDVTFSDGCDLSSVTPPDDGRHLVFSRWRQRLEALLAKSRNWPQDSRKACEAFSRTHLVHAVKQEWYLLGWDDLAEEFGTKTAELIWAGLRDE